MTIGVIIIALFMILPLIIGFIASAKSKGSSDDYFI